MNHFEEKLAEFVSTMTYNDLPDGIEETVTRVFVDTVDVTLAGLATSGNDVVDSSLDQDRCERAADRTDAAISVLTFY